MKPKQSLYDSLLEWLVSTPWGSFCTAALLFALSYSLYTDFTKLENGEIDELWLSRKIVLLYNVGGKWTPVAVFSGLGLAAVAWGVKLLVTGNDDVEDKPQAQQTPIESSEPLLPWIENSAKKPTDDT